MCFLLASHLKCAAAGRRVPASLAGITFGDRAALLALYPDVGDDVEACCRSFCCMFS